MSTSKIEFKNDAYYAAVDFVEADGVKLANMHLTVYRLTPSVMHDIEEDFGQLLALLPDLGVDYVIATSKKDDVKAMKWQVAFGFMPWYVASDGHEEFNIFRYGGYSRGN